MSIPELKPGENGFYYVHWTEGRRSKRVSTRTKDMDAAKAFYGQWLLMEKSAPAGGAEFTVSDLWVVYKAKHIDVKVASKETLETAWKNLDASFGRLHMSEITQDVVDNYVEKRGLGKIGRPSKPSTARRELSALLACLNWCAAPKRKLIAPALVPQFDLPAAGEPRERWLRAEEVERLLAAAAVLRRGVKLSRGERFLWLALETAARKQAILELTWDRVDFQTNVIHYNVPGRVKTKKRRASVPISKALRPILEQAFKERVNDLVMSNQGSVWSTVQLIAIEAGFGGKRPALLRSEKPKATGVSPHVLRHTAATHMARNGVPLWTIAGILGNTMTMVEKVYSHHCPDGLRSGIEQISGRPVSAAPSDVEMAAIMAALKSGKMKLVEVSE